jgi:hypothetical protein
MFLSALIIDYSNVQALRCGFTETVSSMQLLLLCFLVEWLSRPRIQRRRGGGDAQDSLCFLVERLSHPRIQMRCCGAGDAHALRLCFALAAVVFLREAVALLAASREGRVWLKQTPIV